MKKIARLLVLSLVLVLSLSLTLPAMAEDAELVLGEHRPEWTEYIFYIPSEEGAGILLYEDTHFCAVFNDCEKWEKFFLIDEGEILKVGERVFLRTSTINRLYHEAKNGAGWFLFCPKDGTGDVFTEVYTSPDIAEVYLCFSEKNELFAIVEGSGKAYHIEKYDIWDQYIMVPSEEVVNLN